MENIIEKAKKILELSERGCDGEIEAAKRALEQLLRKHDLTIDDIKKTKRTERRFRVKSSFETQLFLHCLLKMFGRESDITKSARKYNSDPKIYADMTILEYRNFEPFFQFHLAQFRKEQEKILKNMQSAYVNKHDLFDSSDTASDSSNVDWEKIADILKVSKMMEDVSYFKQLE